MIAIIAISFIILIPDLCTCQASSFGNRINQFNPGWNCNVDSWESQDYDCAKAYDSNDNTFWHTEFTQDADGAALPHRIDIDLGKVYNIRGITYLPRQDNSGNGIIGKYQLVFSVQCPQELGCTQDGQPYYYKKFSGEWSDDHDRKTHDLGESVQARYFRLDAQSEAGGRGPWSSVAQIDIYEDSGHDTSADQGSSATPTNTNKNSDDSTTPAPSPVQPASSNSPSTAAGNGVSPTTVTAQPAANDPADPTTVTVSKNDPTASTSPTATVSKNNPVASTSATAAGPVTVTATPQTIAASNGSSGSSTSPPLTGAITTNSATSSPETSPNQSSSGLSSSAKVGIGLGVPLGVLALGLLGFLLWRHGRHTKSSQQRHMGNIAAAGLYPLHPDNDPEKSGAPATSMPQAAQYTPYAQPHSPELHSETVPPYSRELFGDPVNRPRELQ
ncbi:MAG: hypothetical protein Q9220_007357 [cf. Caloplaca sp. 1 TL-2023]